PEQGAGCGRPGGGGELRGGKANAAAERGGGPRQARRLLEPELGRCSRAIERACAEPRDVDAVEDHATLPPRQQAEGEALRLLGARDVDDSTRPAREPTLEAEIESARRPRVALVVNAVQRVNGRHAGNARGQPGVQPRALA